MSDQTAVDGGRHLRPLLPAPNSTLPSDGPSRHSSRSNHVRAACLDCRKLKVKCPGERPACRRCVRRGAQCQYSTQPGETTSEAFQRKYKALQDHDAAYKDIFNLLRSLPENDAQSVLQRIRSGATIESVLNHVQAGDLLLQMAVRPETRLRYDFPYRTEMPLSYVTDNPYLDSIIYEAASIYPPEQSCTSRVPDTERESQTPSNHVKYESAYAIPFHAAQAIEPLLADIKISWWTTVSDDDNLLRDLLSVFFRCEYHFSAAFQKDLFLEDMAARRTDFCSSILVNVVLAYSCVCYPQFTNRVEYWNPNTLLYRFLAEAKRIWELEASVGRLTTVQAGILFSVVHNLCGLDEIGHPYRVHAINLAKQMRLLEMKEVGGSDRSRKGIAFTAWTLFNWETLTAFSFMRAPLLDRPPSWSLPDPTMDEQWYGEVHLRYPMTSEVTPSYFGQVFQSKCHFRVIMNDFCQTAYGDNRQATLSQANILRSRLQDWHETLPTCLHPRRIVLPGHLQLHMYYHHLVLTIYEPLMKTSSKKGRESIAQVVYEAKRSLETLIRLYYLRHGYEAMDLFIVIPLMLTAYSCIDSINQSPDSTELEIIRSTLILAIKGLCGQRRNHYLAEALFRVIKGRMRPEEIGILNITMDATELKEDREQTLAPPVRSQWPVSVVQDLRDVDSHILTNLVENYAN